MQPADPERRLRAYAVDRALGWGIALAVGLREGFTGFAVALLAVGIGTALVTGRSALTPGLAAFGLRVVRRSDGRPIGVRTALGRTLLLGLAGAPTLGLGLAALAWTALDDATGERRGLHDRLLGTIVVPAHPLADAVPEPPQASASLVNLTALRLLPDPEPLAAGGAPVAFSARTATLTGSWLLVLETGEAVPVDAAPLGRALLRTAPDGALVVVDRAAEGLVVVRRGHARPLLPGRPATLLDGDLLRLGERVVRVEHRC